MHGTGTSYDIPIELHTISSPYRELTRPILDYLDELDAESPDDIITVVIPEFVTTWSSQFLHNQSALRAQGPPALPAEHGRDLGAGRRRLEPAPTSWPARWTSSISGSIGLIGTALVAALTAAGHRPVRLVRREPSR